MKNKIALMYDKVTFVTSFIDAHRLSFLVLAESLSQACTPFSHSDLINLQRRCWLGSLDVLFSLLLSPRK